jgi:enamine deaminase RidA (YjgF/YER057c/UK114 family)
MLTGSGLAGSAGSMRSAVDAATLDKRAENFGLPWEQSYGYAQGIKVGDTIYLSGQLSHDDEGNLIAPAPLDAEGRIADHGNMGRQMAQSYANAKKLLARYGATMNDVVEEILYVAGKVRAEA